MRFERTETACGAPLYVFPMPHVQSVAVGALVFAGARDEVYPREAGLAHAFEHMVFQGNRRCANSKEISAEIEAFGGAINAWTWNEMTFYHRVVPSEALMVGAQSVASQITDSLFRPEDIAKEMKNVVQEILMNADNPADFCATIFDHAIFGEHPLGKDVLGFEETVSAFTQDDFLSWQERFYHSGNYAFFVVGNTTVRDALEVVDCISWRNAFRSRNIRPHVSDIVGATARIFEERDVKQANVCLGKAIGASRGRDTKALGIYSVMIDGGMSFPLFQEVRDKRGLCYSVSASVIPWSDRGVFRVYVGTDPARVNEAIDCIKEVVWNCRGDAALLERAKKRICGSNAIRFSSPGAVLQAGAVDTVFSGEPRSPEKIRQDIESFAIDEITEAVERHLRPEDFSYAYVVPRGANI